MRVEIPFWGLRGAVAAAASDCRMGSGSTEERCSCREGSPPASAATARARQSTRPALESSRCCQRCCCATKATASVAIRATSTAAHHWCSTRRRRRRNKLHKEKFANQFSRGEYRSGGPGRAREGCWGRCCCASSCAQPAHGREDTLEIHKLCTAARIPRCCILPENLHI